MSKAPPAKSRFRLFASVGDIISELRRVVWPTREEAIRLTIMVLIVCIIVGVFLGVIDYGFTKLVTGAFLRGD
ncbi:preprotein translocase subunit SecE [Chloroflexota bacterium]